MAKAKPAGEVRVALLRGINVGGKCRLAMKDLVEEMVGAGATDVATYIQSGNAVFRGGAEIGEVLTRRIEKRFGMVVPVVVRTAAEMEEVVKGNPFLGRGEAEGKLHVMFLRDAPTKAAVAGLDAKRSPGDEFVVVGREIYLRFPAGIGTTKLTNAYFDARLKTVSTARNWRTVTTLLGMARERA